MSQRILVTGATGFVGRQVMRSLTMHNVELIPVVRVGKEHLVADYPRVTTVMSTDDLFAQDEQWWIEQCQGIDTVIHLAWYAEPGHYLHSERNLSCLAGTLTLAHACITAGVRRFVGIGTCFEYDLSQGGLLHPDTPLKPLSLYAATKASVFQVLQHWLPATGVEFAWCRLFYLYGEGEDARRLVPYIREKLSTGQAAELTSGQQIRDFLDVRDAGAMIAECALSDEQGARNVCSGVPITVRQLAERIADEYGRRDLLRFGARPDNVFDPPCVVGVREESKT